MRIYLFIFVFLIFACFEAMSQELTKRSFGSQKRLALVIGNGKYQNASSLSNPTNDAQSVRDALLKAGFDVFKYENLSQGDLKRAIDEFGNKLKEYEVGLFYYAGHGIQARGYNYLIPIDANLISEEQVEYDCVQADRVLGLMESAGSKTNIIILDACRNNPFERSWKRSASGKGLAFMNAPSGTLIAYATAPGSTASDGSGSNGLYTNALLNNLAIENINILEMFQNVRREVSEKSNGQQIPWESTSLTGNFYFALSKENIVSENTKPAENKTVPAQKKVTAGERVPLETVTITDERDKQKYRYIKIGYQFWLNQNLYLHTKKGSYCYNFSSDNCKKYGLLYKWNIANVSCPQGWRLPSVSDWETLINSLGEGEKASLALFKPDQWEEIQDKSFSTNGFNALPGGYRSKSATSADIGEQAYFWTSTQTDEDNAYCISLKDGTKINSFDVLDKDCALSVRCIKE